MVHGEVVELLLRVVDFGGASEGSIPLIKSRLARRIDSSCSLSSRQGFTRPVVAVSVVVVLRQSGRGLGGINMVRL